MVDNDDLIPDRASGVVAFPTEAAWDNLKETVNNNRRYRLLGVYTTGTFTYNGTNSLAWTADIKILFMATDSDTYYVNTILSTGSPLTCSDDNVIWCRLLNSTSNITLNASTIANFTRAGDLVNQTGDVFIVGFTDTIRFHYVGGISDHIQLSNIGTNEHSVIDTHLGSTSDPHSVTKSQVGLGNVDNLADANQVALGTLTSGDVSTRDSIGLISGKANGDLFYWDTILKKLVVVNDGDVLTLSSGLPIWSSPGAPGGHDIDGASHTLSGATIGHFLKALTATTFGFQAHGLSYGDVGAAASSHSHGNKFAWYSTPANGSVTFGSGNSGAKDITYKTVASYRGVRKLSNYSFTITNTDSSGTPFYLYHNVGGTWVVCTAGGIYLPPSGSDTFTCTHTGINAQSVSVGNDLQFRVTMSPPKTWNTSGYTHASLQDGYEVS